MSIARQNNNQTQPFKTARKMDKKRNNRNLIMDKMIAEYLDTLDTKKQDFLKKKVNFAK
jgi:hypothetical protein